MRVYEHLFAFATGQAAQATRIQLCKRRWRRHGRSRGHRLLTTGSTTLRTSVGIAHALPGSCSIDLLLEAADAALYQAKAGGRGGWSMREPA